MKRYQSVFMEDNDILEFKDYRKWEKEVKKRFPKAKWVTEDGSGKTYGDIGDITVATGRDMQADVVATWTKEDNFGTIFLA